ncbi:hypothetical protein KIPB_013111 [Kipferlia bialata]|uniref:Uncharacterized protein n=1 Tax=Kipferlia bialata TaxID=797122 RepID=A0A391NRR8_9EUKA|nr:hypothetical protein KIPB_013111 [Kipferlia bialata]|eukprot:g13111.t1
MTDSPQVKKMSGVPVSLLKGPETKLSPSFLASVSGEVSAMDQQVEGLCMATVNRLQCIFEHCGEDRESKVAAFRQAPAPAAEVRPEPCVDIQDVAPFNDAPDTVPVRSILMPEMEGGADTCGLAVPSGLDWQRQLLPKHEVGKGLYM